MNTNKDNKNATNQDESIFDRVVPEGLKQKIEHGMESVLKDGRLKNFVGDLKLPKEVINYMVSQVDETKHAAIGIISKEVRLFLEKTNLSEEITKVLTKVSFEVTTNVRFVPNEKVSVTTSVKQTSPEKKQEESENS